MFKETLTFKKGQNDRKWRVRIYGN